VDKRVTDNQKAIGYFGTGVGLLGIFLMLAIYPPPDYVTLQCARTKGICTLDERGFFRSKTKYVKIEEIRDVHSEPGGFMMRGYRGPELKLQDGNDISTGVASNWPFLSKEKEALLEISNFLSHKEIEHLSVTQKGIPTIIFAGIVLLSGLFCIYKGLKPYIIQGFAN
jgi:hypothetical protein